MVFLNIIIKNLHFSIETGNKWGYIQVLQISEVISRYRLFNVKTSKSPHAILDINEERRKWSFGSKTNAKNAWGLLKVIRTN
jgi:hypothetical protein